MDKKLKSGDVVRLKSGGPNMTVDGYVTRFVPDYDHMDKRSAMAIDCSMKREGENVRVLWFPETPGPFHISQAELSEDALIKVDPS